MHPPALFLLLFETSYGQGMHPSLLFASARGVVSGRAANPAAKSSHAMPPHMLSSCISGWIIYWSQFQGVRLE
ncbi:hypothetical protein ACQKWADRAFT_276358 [Trichoderma austrokoningii]